MLMDELRGLSLAGDIKVYPFHYSVEFPIALLLAGATIPLPVVINNDADFVIRQSQLTAYSAAGVFAPAPDLVVTLFDSGSGRNWQDQPQHVRNVLGSGELPFLWTEPAKLAGGSQLIVTLTNRDAIPFLVNITFSGLKVVYLAGYNRG